MLGGTIHHSTIDAGVQLVHNIEQGWQCGLESSVLLFNIAQFYPSVNHALLVAILRRQGCAPALCDFFATYLADCSVRFRVQGAVSEPIALHGTSL